MADLNSLKKAFIHTIVQFLKSEVENKCLSMGACESVEVAIQCLQNAYELDIDDDNKPAGNDKAALEKLYAENIDIWNLYQSKYFENNSEDIKTKAEEIKNEGNRLMKEGKFYEAKLQYDKAIAFDPTNPVFYCNRAAAHTKLNEFKKGLADCKLSLTYNPNYSKAYGRLGVIHTHLQEFDEAREAFKKALEIEPGNQDYINNLELMERRSTQNPNLANILQSIQIENPEITQFLTQMMNDPNFSATMNNMVRSGGSDFMNRIRDYFQQQMVTMYPNLWNEFRDQVADLGQTQQPQSRVNDNSAETSNRDNTSDDKSKEPPTSN